LAYIEEVEKLVEVVTRYIVWSKGCAEVSGRVELW
jgi:hypothetical protein